MQLRAGRALATAIAVVALLGVGVVPVVRAAAPTAGGASPARCASADTPETGLQGDVPSADQDGGRASRGYNCGLALVGYDDLGGQGGGDLAWSGHCAYVKSGGGVKVIDVANPREPRVVDFLQGTGGSAENLHAATTGGRAVLISARTGSANPQAPRVLVDVWDVRDCANPVAKGSIHFSQVHNIELTPDGTHVWASMPLQVADITDLDDEASWGVKDWQCEVAAQAKPGVTGVAFVPFSTDRPQCANMLAHEFDFNSSMSRMYIGGQMPGEDEIRVVDISGPTPKVLSTIAGPGHGMRRATIGGTPYLLHNDEVVSPSPTTAFTALAIARGAGAPVPDVQSPRTPVNNAPANGCVADEANPVAGAAEAFLTDVSNELSPQTVSQLTLAINTPEHCAAQLDSQVKSSAHYTGIDDPDDTRFVMVPMGNAGLRLFDVHDPRAPVEIAYFNPGQFTASDGSPVLDGAAFHTHYDQVKGQIWLTTRVGGFWVLELEPQVRQALGLPGLPVQHPDGAPARGGSTAHQTLSITAADARTGWYCGL
jgi:hypothetical protein